MPPDQIVQAVQEIEEGAKYKVLNKFAPYFMSGIFILNMLFGCWIIWRRRHPYPKSIANIDSKDNAVVAENNEQVNAADAERRG